MRDWKTEIGKQLAGLKLDPVREAEIIEELAQHLEDRYGELLSSGAKEEEAYREALAELSDSGFLARALEPVERQERLESAIPGGGRRRSVLADLWQDLRYGFRMLRKNSGFTAVAVVTLALGIGATTAIFSLVNSILLRPLPFRDADRLVILWNRSPGLNVAQDWLSIAEYVDIKTQSDVFEEVAISVGNSFNLTGGEKPERVEGIRASSSLFPLLDVKPARGRALLPEEDQPGRPPTVIISDEMWRRGFGADPNILGKAITLNGQSVAVVGIMPAGFSLNNEVMPVVGGTERVDVILPLPLGEEALRNRGAENYNVLARLKSGVRLAQAQAQLDTIAGRLRQQYPDAYPAHSGFNIGIVPLLEQVVGDVRRALWILYGAVCLVLLIACVNVANLLLARTAARQKEVAIRTAMGASRSRLIRQLLSESILLSLLGGGLGLLVAMWSLAGLRNLGPGNIPRMAEIGIDYRVLAFTLVLSLVTGVLFGLAPALKTSQVDLNETLKESGRGSMGGTARRRLLNMLVVAEVALSLVLLIGAGLLIRSFMALYKVNSGFSARNILSLRLTLAGSRYSATDARAAFYRQLQERLKTLPGVESVGAASLLPLSPGVGWGNVSVEGYMAAPGENLTDQRVVSADYFQTMRIPLLKGRYFSEGDSKESLKVVIVDEAFAGRYWHGDDPVGKRVKRGDLDSDTPWMTVVGVVGNVRQYTLDAESPRGAMYTPHAQQPVGNMYVVVRTSSEPAGLIGPVRSAVGALDPELPVYNISTMEQRLADSLARRRFSMLLLGTYASLALLLAAVGIYGVVSYSVTQRTHEIGIRLALGAERRHILPLFIGQSIALAATGVVIGLGAALLLARIMSSLLYGVTATDPATFISVGIILIGVALAACLVPARRASKVDPMVALRYE